MSAEEHVHVELREHTQVSPDLFEQLDGFLELVPVHGGVY